jgi:dihydrodipicolinate synthase/N-acetylneuraminate lyase
MDCLVRRAEEMKKFRGIVVPLETPLDKKERVDEI